MAGVVGPTEVTAAPKRHTRPAPPDIPRAGGEKLVGRSEDIPASDRWTVQRRHPGPHALRQGQYQNASWHCRVPACPTYLASLTTSGGGDFGILDHLGGKSCDASGPNPGPPSDAGFRSVPLTARPLAESREVLIIDHFPLIIGYSSSNSRRKVRRCHQPSIGKRMNGPQNPR